MGSGGHRSKIGDCAQPPMEPRRLLLCRRRHHPHPTAATRRAPRSNAAAGDGERRRREFAVALTVIVVVVVVAVGRRPYTASFGVGMHRQCLLSLSADESVKSLLVDEERRGAEAAPRQAWQ